MTDPDRWPRVKDISHSALALPLEERAEFVRESCQEEAALRQDVESLLAAHAEAEGFAETPAIAALADAAAFAGTAAAGALAPGVEFGQYRIVGPLGTGAMGSIVRATAGWREMSP